MLVGKETKVILSGDPMQLGPVVMSRALKDFGDVDSMLKRLSEFEVYKNDR
jgi:superfamily I DNA and/or RNA helicase